MLPNVSKLSLNDDKKCVPCMTPVRFKNRDEQYADHMANFVFRETLEDQIKASDCEICLQPMATNASDAPVRAAAAQSTPFYVDYCGNGHYFHKWCARGLLERAETTPCPDCRAQPTDVARIEIAESYPMTAGGAPAAAAPAAPAPAPAPVPQATTRLPRLARGEERLGAQRATDQLLQWVFWLKPADSAAEDRLDFPHVNDRMRGTFEAYMETYFSSTQEVSRWRQRLQITTHRFYTVFTGEEQPSTNAPVLLVLCQMWLPTFPADRFRNFFDREKRRYMGICSMMRRWLGIIGADVGSPGTDTSLTPYLSWRWLEDHPEAGPRTSNDYAPFRMSRASYNNWRKYSLEDDGLPIIPGRTGPQSATDVPIEWRLWVKGRFANEPLVVGNRVRDFLSRWFHNQRQFQEDAVARDLNIRQRLSLTATYASGARDAVPYVDSPVSRIDCQLYLPTMQLAQAFIDSCKNIALEANFGSQDEDGFDVIMSSIVGVTGARLIDMTDFFHIRTGPLRMSRRMGACPYALVRKPNMGRREYEEWPSHTFLDLPPVSQGVQSQPGPSGEAQPSLGQRLFGDEADPDEDVEMDEEGEEVLEEGTLSDAGPSSSSANDGPYRPTSPAFSPTSPPYSPTSPPRAIDPMTPDLEHREYQGAQRAYRIMDPNDPEYAVTIRWRFWLKGYMGARQVLDAEHDMRQHFGAYMANNSDLRAGNNGFPWYHRLRVEIFGRNEYMTQSRNGVASTNPLVRCEVSLKVSQEKAWEFVSWSMDDRRVNNRSSWAAQAEAWHNYGPTRTEEASDFPRVVDLMAQYPSPPYMSTEDYESWAQWSVLPESRQRTLA